MLFRIFSVSQNKKGSENETAHYSKSERFSWKDCSVLTGWGGGCTVHPGLWSEHSALGLDCPSSSRETGAKSAGSAFANGRPLSSACRAFAHSQRSSHRHQAGEVHADRKLTLCHCHHQLRGQ